MKIAFQSFYLVILCLCLTAAGGEVRAAERARTVLDASGCPGGICVLLGEDAEMAVALSREGKFVVQALVSGEAALKKMRAGIRAANAYGIVSADLAAKDRLPYAENLVNLVVVDAPPAMEAKRLLDECERVLAPLGSVYIGVSGPPEGETKRWLRKIQFDLFKAGFIKIEVLAGGRWQKAVKPWPEEIDEWTHFLHGADGNPVANDTVVAPPKRYQWVSDPTWLRTHESDSSVKTMVTARGRLFYVADEAPASLLGDHDIIPDKWFLTARDAFNGVTLWKVPIEDWGWRAWKPSWFTPRPGDIPLNIQKRLVADGNKVYVTLGYKAPVTQIDARTGEILKTYEGTERTGEFLFARGKLILTVLRDDRARLMSVDVKSGKTLWTSEKDYGGTITDYYRFSAMRGSVTPAKVDPTLNTATDGETIALLDGGDVVGVDFRTGREKWRSAFPLVEADYKAGNIDAGQTVWTGTLIVRDGVAVHASPNQLAGFSTKSGKVLWRQPKKYIGHLWYEWKDVFVIDGLVWTWNAELVKEGLETRGGQKKSASLFPTTANGYDLKTGELKREVPLGNIFKTHHHHRCYRNKATSRYILASRRGTEFVDLVEGKHTVDNWVRGTCHLGMMPANGLQYAPPHPCVCYIEEKLNGMNALAPGRSEKEEERRVKGEGKLKKGPAYAKKDIHPSPFILHPSEDWPTFRGDGMRTGSVKTKVPASLRLLWRESVGKKIAPPIVVGDRLFVPLIDEHHIAALGAKDGKILWERAAGGRIDTPPTYHEGTVIFGSADGTVRCLRASDGEIVWRFRAAPEDRRIGAFGQLESAWPVHGNVLVLDGTAYFAAGRSSHLDGGIYMFGLDAATGEVRCRTRLEGPSYGVEGLEQNYDLPTGYLPDILQGKGGIIHMRETTFDGKLKRQKVAPRNAVERVYSKGGLLDDSYFKRIPWAVEPNGDFGRLAVHDEKRIYTVRMFDSLQGLDPKVYFTPAKKGYLLFATDAATRKKTWERRVPVRVTAMVAADGVLFAAGPPDTVDPKDPLGSFEGRKGGVLLAVDEASGEILRESRLPSPPVFNGMAAARGRLYVAMQDGTVACLGK